MRPIMRNEIHVCDFDNGHLLSTDCWCEPTDISWKQNKAGVYALIVIHIDNTPAHHYQVVSARSAASALADDPDIARNEPDSVWITRALNGTWRRAHPTNTGPWSL